VALAAALTAGATPPPSGAATASAYPGDFPDPFVLATTDGWLAYGTSGPLGRVQVLRSGDLATWSPVGDALGSPPTWAEVGDGPSDGVWAPAVLRRGDTYLLFSSVRRRATGRRCLAVATGTGPAGPFTDTGAPLLCDDARGGAIDPSVLDAGSGTWLYWKTEGVPGTAPPTIWGAALAPDGRSLAGPPVPLVRADQPWEYPVVENPSMVPAPDGRWFLFYSANRFDDPAYAIGYAVCASALGPCSKPPLARVLAGDDAGEVGPGGPEWFPDRSGRRWLAYHAWTSRDTSYPAGRRTLRLRPLDLGGLRPSVGGAVIPAWQRVAGPDRFATAAAFSAATVPPFAPVVYVATGEAFPDALAGSAAAGVEASPVLLVERDALPQATAAELARLRPGHIVVLGGPAAVSDAVVAALAPYAGGSIHREPGTDRFDTAARVSANTFRGGAPVAYVATGEAFPDALAAGAAGARNGGPVLLVTRDTIPGPTARELARLRPGRIVVVGGPSAVSPGVMAALTAYTPGTVTRVAGPDRYATALALAEAEFPGPLGGTVIASGVAFPDAVVAGAAGYPLVLAPPSPAGDPRVREGLDRLAPQGSLVVGGPATLSDAAVHAIDP
jgi:putative cell wall-binding protein